MIPASSIPLRVFGDIRTIKLTEEILWWYPWIADLQENPVHGSVLAVDRRQLQP
jgi:hypothetical protein